MNQKGQVLDSGVAASPSSFFVDLWRRFSKDETFFLASGLAFNVLFCFMPILFLGMYIIGIWFQSKGAMEDMNRLIELTVPNETNAIMIRNLVGSVLREMASGTGAWGWLNGCMLVILSASLFSSIRSVLNRVYRVTADRPLVIAYVVDMLLVLVTTLLIVLIVCFRSFLIIADNLSPWFPFLSELGNSRRVLLLKILFSFPIVMVLCMLLYRYVPEKWVSWKTAALSSIVAVSLWELAGTFFSYYVDSFHPFTRMYGTYGFVIMFLAWIYYSSIVFIVGAQSGQVWRERKKADQGTGLKSG